MGVKQIRIEDIEVDIPSGIDDRWSKSTRRTITGGLLTQRKQENKGSTGFSLDSLTKTQAAQLLELQRNYAFNSTVIAGISRVWDARLVLDSIKVDYRWYDRKAAVSGSLQLNPTWKFIGLSMERPIHGRWKYVIAEDFSTGVNWPDNGAWDTTESSPGYDVQEQTIDWIEVSGSWETDDTIYMVGDNSSNAASAPAWASAGWLWWSNYEASVWIYADNATTDARGLAVRFVDTDNWGYLFYVTSTVLKLERKVGGTSEDLWVGDNDTVVDEWIQFKIVVEGCKISCFLNGEKMCELEDEEIGAGMIALYSNVITNYFDEVRVVKLSPIGYNLPSDVSRTTEFITSIVNTAHGEQKQLIDPADVEFEFSWGDDCALSIPIDEGSGTPRDKSKFNNIVTLTGGSWIEDEIGTVLEFNGSSDKITVDDGANLDTDLSTAGVVVWQADLKFDAVNDSTWHAIIMKDNCYHIQHNTSNQIQLYVYESGADSDLTWTYSSALSVGVWYRFTFIWIEADWMGIFVDGDLKASKTPTGGTLSTSADDVEIGGNTANGRWFDGRIKDVSIYKNVQEDVIFGFNRTPATVFVFDDNGTTDARYRTTTLMYDLNVMTRVYHKSHVWTGRPVITNGLVTLSFPEISSIVWPIVHVWYDNNWVIFGSIQPMEERNAVTLDITEATSYKWMIEELTDQYCKIRVTWYANATSGLPEGTFVRLWLTVRNGYPGVLVESDKDDPSVGWLVEFQGYGDNGTEVIAFLPKDTTLDVRSGGTTSYAMTDVDDNWMICYNDAEDIIKGMFVDSINDNGGNMWIVTDTSNLISDVRCYGKYGGVFYVLDTDDANNNAQPGLMDVKVRRY